MAEEFGMVLAGGGGKGAYQVGVFNALKEYNLAVSAVSGTSVGGINAFAYACLSNREINELWDDFTFGDFFSPDDDWSDGISDRVGLENILNEYVDEDRLSNAFPIYNTICENAREPEYIRLNSLSKDEAVSVILATSALPVIYSRVSYNGKDYKDGGLADNLPVKPLYDLGYRDLIVVGLSANQRINQHIYPTDRLIEIYPSYNLGDLVSGTLNFSRVFKSYAKKLGYMDAKRVLNDYFGIDNGCHTAEFDFNQIQTELRADKLQSSVNDNLNGIYKFLK